MANEPVTEAVVATVRAGDAVLDVGGGMAEYHPALLHKIGSQGRLVILDAHQPYLDRAVTRPNVGKLCGDARVLLPKLQAKSYDVVLGIDFVEHMTHLDALQVMHEMQRLAKREVILFVPEGHHPQDKDYFELGGDAWQTHRSEWKAEDLTMLGFAVTRWENFHKDQGGGKDPHALWCTWPITHCA